MEDLRKPSARIRIFSAGEDLRGYPDPSPYLMVQKFERSDITWLGSHSVMAVSELEVRVLDPFSFITLNYLICVAIAVLKGSPFWLNLDGNRACCMHW